MSTIGKILPGLFGWYGVGKGFIESPWHKLSFDPQTGEITGLVNKENNWQVIDGENEWNFCQIIHEQPEPRNREAYHKRNLARENQGISNWINDWTAIKREAHMIHAGLNRKKDVPHWSVTEKLKAWKIWKYD